MCNLNGWILWYINDILTKLGIYFRDGKTIREKSNHVAFIKTTKHLALQAPGSQNLNPLPPLLSHPPAQLTSSRLRRSWLSSVLVLLSWVSRSRILFWAARSLETACSLVCSTCPEGTEVELAYLTWGTPGEERAGPRPLSGLPISTCTLPWRGLWSLGAGANYGGNLNGQLHLPLPTTLQVVTLRCGKAVQVPCRWQLNEQS